MDVLVADDDEDIRFMLTAMLGRRGWTVTTAVSGEDALSVLGSSDFDVLVLDQNMPPGSGLEVVEQCRREGDSTPAVLFTGYAAPLDRSEAERQRVTVVEKGEVARLVAVVGELGEN